MLLLGLMSANAFAADPKNCKEVFEVYTQYLNGGTVVGLNLISNSTPQNNIDAMNLYQTCRIASALEDIAERMK